MFRGSLIKNMRFFNKFYTSSNNIGFVVLLLLSFLLSSNVDADENSDKNRLVILVRHAEKALTPGSDPSLTEVGRLRAQTLATALAHAGIGAIITTELRRTRETAKPLAKALNLTPQIVNAQSRNLEEHVRAVVKTIKHQRHGAILVIGHSNTIPAIVQALGGPTLPIIDENDYSTLLLLSISHGKKSLVRARY